MHWMYYMIKSMSLLLTDKDSYRKMLVRYQIRLLGAFSVSIDLLFEFLLKRFQIAYKTKCVAYFQIHFVRQQIFILFFLNKFWTLFWKTFVCRRHHHHRQHTRSFYVQNALLVCKNVVMAQSVLQNAHFLNYYTFQTDLSFIAFWTN